MFDSEPVYNDKYIKTKITLYNGKINIKFFRNEIPEDGTRCACLSIILWDSVVKENIIHKYF